MSEAYETNLDRVLAAIVTVIEGTTSFNAATVNYDYRVGISTYPTARIRLVRDSFTAVGAMETMHEVQFEIRIHHRCKGTEGCMDTMIGYVGEIVDAIEADRTLGTALSDHTAEVVNIEYSFRRDQDAIFYYAYLTVAVRHLRNV